MTTQVKLVRFGYSPMATQGLLFGPDGEVLCHTIENAYKDNKPYISSVPTGSYQLAFRNEGGFYNRYMKKAWANSIGQERGLIHMLNIPDRTYCLWHIGNFHKNTQGCVLLNNKSQIGEDDEWRGVGSLSAYKRIYPIIAGYIENDDYVEVVISDA